VASPALAYQPRIPVQDVLYQVVRDHFEMFRAQAAGIRDGAGTAAARDLLVQQDTDITASDSYA
jgi:hypothetical protein